MLRKFILSALALSALFFVPAANALTLEQAQNEVAGYHCSGNGCTKSTTVSTTTQNPDIVNSTQVMVSPAYGGTSRTLSVPGTNSDKGGFWSEKCQTYAYVNDDCTVQSIADHDQGGSAAVFQTVTTVTPGGTTNTVTCSTTTKQMNYNGPNTDRANAWSVSSSTSSSAGAC